MIDDAPRRCFFFLKPDRTLARKALQSDRQLLSDRYHLPVSNHWKEKVLIDMRGSKLIITAVP